MPEYLATFEVGEQVRIAVRARLEEFERVWRYHHPLAHSQLAFASQIAKVLEVAFYHGGDPLYRLCNAPGIWHEQCLTDPTLDQSPPASEVYWIKSELHGGENFLVVRDVSGRTCYSKPQSLYENGDIDRMSEILRKRSAAGFAGRFGFEALVESCRTSP